MFYGENVYNNVSLHCIYILFRYVSFWAKFWMIGFSQDAFHPLSEPAICIPLYCCLIDELLKQVHWANLDTDDGFYHSHWLMKSQPIAAILLTLWYKMVSILKCDSSVKRFCLVLRVHEVFLLASSQVLWAV